MNPSNINVNTVTTIAKVIAACDFAVTISRYVTSDDAPWVITVSHGSRHGSVVVISSNEDGTEAELGVLPVQGTQLITALQTHKVESTVLLSELVAGNFRGVREVLMPDPVPAY